MKLLRKARGLMALVLAVMLLFSSGLVASAEINSEIVDRPHANITYWRITTFSGEMPSDIAKALSTGGFSGYDCYSGAMLEQLADQMYRGTADSLSARALVAVEKGDERILLGMAWKEKEWVLCNLGEKALLAGREFTIGATDTDNDSVWYVPLRFTISYPVDGGGNETYGLTTSDRLVSEAQPQNAGCPLWVVGDYTREDADGRGIAIMNGEGAVRTFSLPFNKYETESYYPGYLPYALEYMDSIQDFPTSDAQARQAVDAFWERFEGTDIGVATGGVNLRQYPTMASQSLCRVRTGALVHVLGEEKGWIEPWYHVRMGQVEGFISGTYLKLPQADDFTRSLATGPLTVASAIDVCTLRESPEEGAKGKEFPAGTRMHVLADVEEGWLYVTVPREEIDSELDMEGTSGYVLASDVLEGVHAYDEAQP